MSLDVKCLETNINLFALQPAFLNNELHYVIAKSEDDFRFVPWDDEPGGDEQKFYCFLTNHQLFIPAGNISLLQSYEVSKESIYPVVTSCTDFDQVIKALRQNSSTKCIRRFANGAIDDIKACLEEKHGVVQKHIVASNQGRHIIFVVNNIEISISATIVYFRCKTPISDIHYQHMKEEEENK